MCFWYSQAAATTDVALRRQRATYEVLRQRTRVFFGDVEYLILPDGRHLVVRDRTTNVPAVTRSREGGV